MMKLNATCRSLSQRGLLGSRRVVLGGHRAARPSLYSYNPRRLLAMESISVVPFIQSYLLEIKILSGLPWWSTIALSTIAVRAASLPLIRLQLIASRKLAVAMPEINFLFQLLRNRLRHIPIGKFDEQWKILAVFFRGVRACLVLHDVSVAELILYPMVNIGIFVSFVYSVRDMLNVRGGELGMDMDGMGWFVELSEKDKTFILPLSAIGLSYIATHIATSHAQGKVIIFIKDLIQSTLLLSVPMVANLPAGVFCYWIPSSIFGIGQSLLLRNATVQRLIKLPPPPQMKR